MFIKSDRYKVFLLCFFISVSAILLAMFGRDTQSALYLSGFVGLILFIGRPLWFTNRHSDTAVKLYSLFIAISAVFAFVGWKAFLEDIFKAVLQGYYPSLADEKPEVMAAIVFTFLAFIIYVVNKKFQPDRTGMGIHPKSIDLDIPEPSFEDRLKKVCMALTDDLKLIDSKTNWSTHLFTPLDAEVEVNTTNGKNRKITDLLQAIKKSNKRLFLVLGAPGSGKSVALRKLCQDLASEVDSTGKVPIYINLREWHLEEKWSEHSPPTIKQLEKFVKKNVMNRDIVTTKFFKKYFDRLYETGRLYFVFDSFDEIPQVLNEKENSELIHQLSEVIFKFLKGARQESQGILASRMFRKPTMEFQSEVTLEIRPFTEEKIIQTFKNIGSFDEKIIKSLFRERPEFVPIARNPFSAVLIAEYTDRNNGSLPLNQSEMYASYIEQTLDVCEFRINQKKLTKISVIEHTIEIASRMFNQYGLEAQVTQLAKDLPNIPVEDVIDILKFARLGRAGSGDDNVFSFSHRRFTEYFTVNKTINSNEKISLNAIPEDSQWRDALVLYCEVVEQSKATSVAEFCWNVISEKNNLNDKEVIHSLRFLRDAFRGRPECINGFREELAIYVKGQIHKKNDVLSMQLIIEILPLLSQSDIDSSISAALRINNGIIDDSSIKIYRNLSSVSKPLIKDVSSNVDKKDISEILYKRKQLLFSFSLSDAFDGIRKRIKERVYSFWLLIVINIIGAYYLPFTAVGCFLFVLFSFILLWVLHLLSVKNYNPLSMLSLFYSYSVFMGFVIFIILFISVSPKLSSEVIEERNISRINFLSEMEEMCKTTKCYRLDVHKENKVTNDSDSSGGGVSSTLFESTKDYYNYANRKVEILIYMILLSFLTILSLHGRSGFLFYRLVLSVFNDKKIIINTFFWISFSFLLVLFSKKYNFEVLFYKYERYFLYFVLAVIFIVLIHLFFKVIISFSHYLKRMKLINNISEVGVDKKENIHAFFTSTDIDEDTRLALVSYLEKNIKLPKGQWPDLSIFNADKNQESFIRLAMLEKKWRETS